MDELIANDKVQTLVEAEAAAKNMQFARFETIKEVTPLPEFTIANGLITPSW